MSEIGIRKTAAGLACTESTVAEGYITAVELIVLHLGYSPERARRELDDAIAGSTLLTPSLLLARGIIWQYLRGNTRSTASLRRVK